MAEYQSLLVFAISSLCSGVGVGAVLKTDIKWLRFMMENIDSRVTRLENES
ncbi:hypothetical protein [Vibrio caribbeanicus]|uniref:Uncharacterized protein n=1 Tax=Vibrio caribbeanicus ATCC BAA-2122 TaxID=796620 RepID=E3BHZ1_9VIBR|nr:hypothetical protein [Vibrio caribbeanicus]EFP97430.1 hypothetical protein VIBC2010_18604 [Vibrio caribbeanicus ATCC BAA-2122]